MNNTIAIIDSDGNTYTLAEPQECGQAHYALDRHGDVIVVAKFKAGTPKPQFVLAPAVETEEVTALKSALKSAASPLRFTLTAYSAADCTKRWAIRAGNDEILGTISWHEPWRRYVAQMLGSSIMDSEDLIAVRNFLTEETIEHRNKY